MMDNPDFGELYRLRTATAILDGKTRDYGNTLVDVSLNRGRVTGVRDDGYVFSLPIRRMTADELMVSLDDMEDR